MIIAVDFDGTIVEHKYPAIGKEIPFAFETLRKLQTEHHKLILWSVRVGKLLDEAVTFFRIISVHGVKLQAPLSAKGDSLIQKLALSHTP